MGCGPDNPHGLGLVVYRSADVVYADVTFDERHIGAPGLAHGGAVAAACDDVLGFTLWIAGTPAVTRALTVEYLQPVPLHQPHRITAHITGRRGGRFMSRRQGSRKALLGLPRMRCSSWSTPRISPLTATSVDLVSFSNSSRAAAATKHHDRRQRAG